MFLGGPPALILAAIAPLPEDVPELVLASVLAGEKVRMTKNPLGATGIRLVAEAEFALVGHVPPRERRPEGPFGDHYGYYSLQHDYPVFQVEAVFHRRDAIYPATVVGKPRQEDFFIGDYLQKLLSPLFPLVMPSVRDLWTYGETGFHSLARGRRARALRARSPRLRLSHPGRRPALADQISDPHRHAAGPAATFANCFEHVLARVRPKATCSSSRTSRWTRSITRAARSTKAAKPSCWAWVTLCASCRASFSGELPRDVTRAEVFCGGCLVVEGVPYAEDPNRPRVWRATRLSPTGRSSSCTTTRALRASTADFLWATWTRFEPAADIYAAETNVVAIISPTRAPIVIDARMKPGYPEELIVRPDIAELVDRRWNEYFPE